jgi:hypothetical protein
MAHNLRFPFVTATAALVASVASLAWFTATPTAAAESDQKQVVFEGAKPEHRWTLNELGAELPSDWSAFSYLVMEFRVSSPQRFFLWLHNADGPRRLVIQPFGQNVWMRASIPLAYFKGRDQKGFDLASANNRPQNSFFMNIWGPFGKLDAIKAVSVAMDYPVGKPALEIRSVRLAKDDEGSDFLEKLPVVDEFGQWIAAEWPGKIKNIEQLKAEWAQEDRRLEGADFDYSPYGGYMQKKVNATGFFRVDEIDGKWWFVDPDGYLFFSTGVNCVGTGGGTNSGGREDYFAALPRADLTPPGARGANAPRSRSVSFYSWNLLRRLGPDWREKWIDLTLRRMDRWGLNTVGNWSDQKFYGLKKKPYVVTLRGWGMETGYLGLPDVYSDRWVESVDKSAETQCAPRKDDPYLLGYFIGNEPPWPGRERDLVDAVLAGKDAPIQRELKKFLEQGDTPSRRREFVFNSFEKYLNTINAAVRKYDPNHLNLGIRFGGHVSDEILRMGRLFDVNSINIYDYAAISEVQRAYKLAGRPVIIGEFHNGVPANGLGAGLVQVADQKQRGTAYSYYVEQSAALPELIGTHWFQWLDEPVTGRMDGENYNIGFVDVTDRPYWDFVNAVIATHKRLFDVHSGTLPPANEKAKVQ